LRLSSWTVVRGFPVKPELVLDSRGHKEQANIEEEIVDKGTASEEYHGQARAIVVIYRTLNLKFFLILSVTGLTECFSIAAKEDLMYTIEFVDSSKTRSRAYSRSSCHLL
jgi:hypothetical protein